MFLIVGLGNIGVKYELTRHNIGFILADNLYDFLTRNNDFNIGKINYKISGASGNFTENKKFNSYVASCNISSSDNKIKNEKIIIIKPTTFMNLSGDAVVKIISYYKIKLENILVIHDDIDLSFNQIKCKIGGGHGGHNGLRSIDSHIGKNYQRFRFGVGRPEEKSEVANYVLNNFSKNELDVINNDMQNYINLILQKLL